MTSAELCRANGWKVGDVIERRSHFGLLFRFRVTAIGERFVLSKRVLDDGHECREVIMDDMDSHGWHKVADNTKGGG